MTYLEILRREIESDIHNLKESQKLQETKQTQQYIKRLDKGINELMRFIGRTVELQTTNRYIRLNKIAHERGETWLKENGVIIWN